MSDLVVIVSDLHCNSPAGLFPPGGLADLNGNHTSPNTVQRWLWDRWLRFWDVTAESVKQAGRWHLIVNGEVVDGFHHRSTEFIFSTKTDMRALGMEVLRPALELSPTSTFIVRGTEAHSGPQGEDDEEAGRVVGGNTDPITGASSFQHLRVAVNGTPLDIKHHTRGARLPWTRGGNANRLAAQLTYEHYHDDPADRPLLAIRSHVHLYADSGALHPIRVIVTDPWQLQTAYAHKIDAGAGLSPVGGLHVWCDGPNFEVEHAEGKQWFRPKREPMLRV